MLYGEDRMFSNDVDVLRRRTRLEQRRHAYRNYLKVWLGFSNQSSLQFTGQPLEFLRLDDPLILEITNHLWQIVSGKWSRPVFIPLCPCFFQAIW